MFINKLKKATRSSESLPDCPTSQPDEKSYTDYKEAVKKASDASLIDMDDAIEFCRKRRLFAR